MTFGLRNWMTELNDLLKNIPVIQLAIPGTHDSMTYSITPSSPIAPDSEEIVKVLTKYFLLPKRIVCKWCITQNATVTHQLNLGIRYFDLRLATKPPEQELYFVHGLYASPIDGPLRELNNFLNENTKEVVILDFQHFYDFSAQDHQMLLQEIRNIYRDKLCPVPIDLNTVTLKWMKEHDYQVIIIYRNEICRYDRKVWPGRLWPTPWPNTTDTKILIDFLTEGIKNRCNDVGFVTQCILTPDIPFVFKHPCGGLENSCAQRCYRSFLPWLAQQTPGLCGVNVVISDFFDMEGKEFCKTVIDLNYKLIQK